MKNYEKYEDEIRSYESSDSFCNGFVKPHILKDHCNGIDCTKCRMLQAIWLLKDYEEPKEPEIDWSKVEVDTPILVRQGEKGQWLERHFAKYENGNVYAWVDGQTSWTGVDEIKWKYAKLAEGEKECEEPKVDWSMVEVDTPIFVKNSEDEMWRKRHFAKYKNGSVYAWSNGFTSWTENYMASWKYAKLAEDAKEDKEPEVDWNEVKIDTPIMVRDSENGDWFKRYFAEYKNGKIYTWDNGHTSWETSRMIEWKYAKLVEDEE